MDLVQTSDADFMTLLTYCHRQVRKGQLMKREEILLISKECIVRQLLKIISNEANTAKNTLN